MGPSLVTLILKRGKKTIQWNSLACLIVYALFHTQCPPLLQWRDGDAFSELLFWSKLGNYSYKAFNFCLFPLQRFSCICCFPDGICFLKVNSGTILWAVSSCFDRHRDSPRVTTANKHQSEFDLRSSWLQAPHSYPLYNAALYYDLYHGENQNRRLVY